MKETIRKIAPAHYVGTDCRADGSIDDNDRAEIGPTPLAFSEWQAQGLTPPNLSAMREYRLQRIVAELQKRDLAGVLLFDPLNIRYATDATNMQVWTLHNYARACFVSASGYMILWDFHGSEHLSAHLPLIQEVRHGASFFYFETGERTKQHATRFAQEVASVLAEHGATNRRLAVDKIEVAGLRELDKLGIEVGDGQAVMEHARVIKGEDELKALRCSIASTEVAMGMMQQASQEGATENDIWSILHAENIRRGGEWIECRIMSSGPRTNPWFQECGPRVIKNGELLALDTDLVGPYGMCADISRTWVIGGVTPSVEQRQLYQVAYDHIMYNMQLLKPGVSYLELSEKGHRLPVEFRAQRYGVMMHGVGLCDEFPCIRYPEDVEAYGYDGVLEPGVVLCVEAYIGAVGGKQGVKLEDQVVVTEDGFENLTRYPFEESLLA